LWGGLFNQRRIGNPPAAITQRCIRPFAACRYVGRAILPAAAFPGGSCGPDVIPGPRERRLSSDSCFGAWRKPIKSPLRRRVPHCAEFSCACGRRIANPPQVVNGCQPAPQIVGKSEVTMLAGVPSALSTCSHFGWHGLFRPPVNQAQVSCNFVGSAAHRWDESEIKIDIRKCGNQVQLFLVNPTPCLKSG
jgi:hypothetical protein